MKKPERGDLRLDVQEDATEDRGGYKAIEPGNPEASEIITRINTKESGKQMPPPKSGHKLSQDQKELLVRWVREGAAYQEHWSFRKPVRPDAPKVRESQLTIRNPIDAFVFSKLEQNGLKPEPEADHYTLLRRVSLDLIGLPPMIGQIEAFVKDSSPNAYEKAVDRLLASPRFGEHWARLWLDLARYADTKGYEKDQPRQIWRYRDWVIDAFNADMPYDQFTIEQLAGDLLPGATESQILATAFHRNTMTNDEGGTDDEEFRVAAVKDRVDTTVQVWMGLTMGCAKCHSHKYDPISQQDYYSFYAVFNQTEDADRFDDSPHVPTPTAGQKQRIGEIESRLAKLREEFWRKSPELESMQHAWEQSIAAASPWTILPVEKAVAESGAALAVQGDGAILASGERKEKDAYSLSASIPIEKVTAIRLEVLKHPSLPNGGPGRDANDQNAVISEFVVTHSVAEAKEPKPVPLHNARADFSQKGFEVVKAIDGNMDSGWAWSPENAKPHVAIFELKSPLESRAGHLVITIKQNYPKLHLGCFRIAVTGADPKSMKPEFRTLGELAALPRDKRTPDEQKSLDEEFRKQQGPLAAVHKQITEAEKELAEVNKQVSRTPIMRELAKDKQRVTRIHQRGNFLDPGEEVQPAIPVAFGPLPPGTPLNRLGVAQWLVSRDNPLTARVAVNRFWARLFGNGLVETEEDFGSQGTMPTHPELLDWLAIEFMDGPEGNTKSQIRNPNETNRSKNPWSMKSLLRTIVTSATYQQASHQDPTKVAADPRNLLFSRGPRFRLPAEVVRDQSLAATGLLSTKMHGPSVMPPQPPGLWKAAYSSMKWETSPGEDRYRRALYTFLRRTSPYPSMSTFDAGSGEVCTIRRVRTNTPLQALVTLNDPAFVETAGALGRRMFEDAGPGTNERLVYGFRLILIRPPTSNETKRLSALYDNVLADFKKNIQNASDLLQSANIIVKDQAQTAELAAYAVVANVLLNLDETVTKP